MYLGQIAEQRPASNAYGMAYFCCCLVRMEIQNTGLLEFVRVCAGAASGPTTRFGGRSTCGGPLRFQFLFHLCNRPHDRQKTPPCCGRRIDIFPQ